MPKRTRKLNRETWLNALVKALRPMFIAEGAPIPKKIRIACGFPRAKGGGGAVVGQAWHSKSSDDNTGEIFVSPTIADKMRVMEIVVHECTHHAVGIEHQHGKAFRVVAIPIGLEGKLTNPQAGKELRKTLRTIGAKLGKYPHAALVPGETIKRNKNRHLKVVCAKKGCPANYRSSFGNYTDHGAPSHCGKEMEIELA